MRSTWNGSIEAQRQADEAFARMLASVRPQPKAEPRKKRRRGNRRPALTREEQYRHPRWLRLRKVILRRDGYRCTNCKAINRPLHIHHLWYKPGGKIWDVPLSDLVTLCECCHTERHGYELTEKQLPEELRMPQF